MLIGFFAWKSLRSNYYRSLVVLQLIVPINKHVDQCSVHIGFKKNHLAHAPKYKLPYIDGTNYTAHSHEPPEHPSKND